MPAVEGEKRVPDGRPGTLRDTKGLCRTKGFFAENHFCRRDRRHQAMPAAAYTIRGWDLASKNSSSALHTNPKRARDSDINPRRQRGISHNSLARASG